MPIQYFFLIVATNNDEIWCNETSHHTFWEVWNQPIFLDLHIVQTFHFFFVQTLPVLHHHQINLFPYFVLFVFSSHVYLPTSLVKLTHLPVFRLTFPILLRLFQTSLNHQLLNYSWTQSFHLYWSRPTSAQPVYSPFPAQHPSIVMLISKFLLITSRPIIYHWTIDA